MADRIVQLIDGRNNDNIYPVSINDAPIITVGTDLNDIENNKEKIAALCLSDKQKSASSSLERFAEGLAGFCNKENFEAQMSNKRQ